MKAGTGWTSNNKLDYSKVSTEEFSPLEPGIYKAVITEAKPHPTKKEAPMIKLLVEVVENANGERLPKPRKVFDNMVLSEKALFRVAILSDALDIARLESDAFEVVEDYCSEVVDAAKDGVFVRLTLEDYTARDGSTKKANRIGRYLKSSEAGEAETTTSSSNGAGTSTPMTRPRRGAPTATA